MVRDRFETDEVFQRILADADHEIDTGLRELFYKAVFAGFIVAGVVWIDFAARDTVSRLVIIYMGFLAIPSGNLFHVVVSFTEMVFLVLEGHIRFVAGFSNFVLPVLMGNTVGGVLR